MSEPVRCAWCLSSPLMIQYHDHEWGIPLHDDKKLFEFLVLDAFQAGLSWSTVLNKRAAFREAFEHFDWNKVAKFDAEMEEKLCNNPLIIRNKLKIKATISNAIAFQKVIDEFGSFNKYIWQFVGNKTITNRFKSMAEIPAVSKEAETMSKDLKKRGFKFVGPTICYAFMQAAGLINDHITSCHRYHEITNLG